jgi:hypothetical protein
MAPGAAVGAAVTFTTGASDLGTAMSAGATVGIAARKAISASLQRPRLRRRALGLKTEFSNVDHPSAKALIDQLDREQRLWERKPFTMMSFPSRSMN